jgi:hypothetical protein
MPIQAYVAAKEQLFRQLIVKGLALLPDERLAGLPPGAFTAGLGIKASTASKA